MKLKGGWRRGRQIAGIALSCVLLTAVPASAFALENGTDTVWGSIPATAYIARAFYENGNTITVPIAYIEAIEGDGSLKEKALEAHWEAQRQSCYLYGDRSATVEVGKDAVTITRNAYYDLETEKRMRDAVEKEADRILGSILREGMSDYEKARAIYQYVSRAAAYDQDACAAIESVNWQERIGEWANAVSAYGVLIEGRSVCQGDAQAYILLARKAGLTAIMATGDMPDGSLHAWNRVWCNNRWYEVDCCYNLICSSFEDYQANVGAVYGGVGIIKSNMGEFYG